MAQRDPADLQERGLKRAPQLAIGDGALGFWAALEEAWPETRCQRCWVHKACTVLRYGTANVLNELPKSIQGKAKAGLREIWMAETKVQAEKAFDRFVGTFSAKYPKAVDILAKDRAVLEDLLRLSGRALGSHSNH